MAEKVNYLAEARDLFPYTQEMRRDFHRHPELGFEETRTSGVIAEELRELEGLQVQTGIAETGVMALMENEKPGPVVLLRFDMDALPVDEKTGVPYASQRKGVMHACGHDGHMAIGLTVAHMLHEQRDQLPGTLKLVFQPAEEGLGGAKRMIAEGVLENPRPDYCLALHLWNEKQIGWFGITDGPMMAASGSFTVTVEGKGGHGATPEDTVDPVLAAAQIISNVQSIISREISPLAPAVITVGSIQGGNTHNVIPPEVVLEGTIRSFDRQVREKVLSRFEEMVRKVGEAHRCRVDIFLEEVSLPVDNDPDLASLVRGTARELFPELTIDDRYQVMVSEDMSLMMEHIPSCYFLIGSANEAQGLVARHHHPGFNFDERAMIHGAALMAASASALFQI